MRTTRRTCFGTRRIGPDLTRVGLKYSNEWHYAHFWNPRMLTPESIMAPYAALFDNSAPGGQADRRCDGTRTLETMLLPSVSLIFASKDPESSDAPGAEQVRRVVRIFAGLADRPQRRVSPVTGRTYCEWQYQQPSRK